VKKVKVGFLAGSLRKGSYSRAAARLLMELLPDNYEAELIELSELTMYNEDLDNAEHLPTAWKEFRAKIQDKDAFIFVTPEYNRSIPAVLKNAIDIASRPYTSNLWYGKAAAIFSHSPGKIGGFGANHHLRQVIAVLNVYTLQQPEAYVGDIAAQIDTEGNVISESLKGFLKKFTDAFVAWTNRFVSPE
jgi:chromate reductase